MSPGGSQLNKSYFFAIDDLYGYGNISYFTFFSEFNRSWEAGGAVEAGLMVTLFVASLLGNSVIIGYIYNTKRARTITNYFVCNLAIADILFSMSAPFVAYVRITSQWRLGKFMCGFVNYVMFVCAFVMIWTMTIISIDRRMCINAKGVSKHRMKPIHVAIICMCIWVVAVCSFLPIAIFFHVKELPLQNETIRFCTLLWPNSNTRYSTLFTSLLLALGFATPLCLIAVNYYNVFKTFWQSKRTISNMTSTTSRPSNSVIRVRDLRIVKTLVLLVVAFIIMWSPLFITFGLIQHDVSTQANGISSSVLAWTLIIAYLNPFVNPFMYGFINTEIGKHLMTCCKHRRVVTDASQSSKPRRHSNMKEAQPSTSITHL